VWNTKDGDKEKPGKELEGSRIQAGNAVKVATLAGRGKTKRGGDENDPKQMTCVAFWPWGRALTGYRHGGVALWDLNTGKELAKFPSESNQNGAYASAVAISPDGHHGLAALTDGAVYLYRLPPPTHGKP
jgi:WD40 repeat protein